MNIISNILNNKRKNKSCALIPFITAGYPNIDMTVDALRILDEKGADIIELGIPYSDALADGPVIQKASEVALKQGINIDNIINILRNVQNSLSVPIVIFTYYNPILVRGLDKFLSEISQYGAKGLIVPDLPIEETDYLIYLCSYYDIELILFIAPTSSDIRISNILSKSPGCLYLVSSTGVTGIRQNINASIKDLSNYVKSKTDKLIMLGFGISNSLQVSELTTWNIDGIVMGSAFVKIFSDESLNNQEISDKLSNFCSDMRKAIDKVSNN